MLKGWWNGAEAYVNKVVAVRDDGKELMVIRVAVTEKKRTATFYVAEECWDSLFEKNGWQYDIPTIAVRLVWE